MTPDDTEHQYRPAVALSKAGKKERVRAMLEGLAAIERESPNKAWVVHLLELIK